MIPHCDYIVEAGVKEECCFCLLPEISDLGYVLQSVDKVDRWPAGTQCSSIIIDFQRQEARDRLR